MHSCDPVNIDIMKWLLQSSTLASSIYPPFLCMMGTLKLCCVGTFHMYTKASAIVTWVRCPECIHLKGTLTVLAHGGPTLSLSALVGCVLNALLSEILCLPFGIGRFSFTHCPPLVSPSRITCVCMCYLPY